MLHTIDPIGTFHTDIQEKYEVPWQSTIPSNHTSGIIRLKARQNFEQALEDLEGFDKIWVIFWFHRNRAWRPKVQPPRSEGKRGLFATRSPHRPNPLGMSCVDLLEIRGRDLLVGSHDLLNGTPIIDIKPYLAYADAFPNAKCGWVEEIADTNGFQVVWSPTAEAQMKWIFSHGGPDLQSVSKNQLAHPYLSKRVKKLSQSLSELAYKSWRLRYTTNEQRALVTVTQIASGYTTKALTGTDDPWGDLALHQAYTKINRAY